MRLRKGLDAFGLAMFTMFTVAIAGCAPAGPSEGPDEDVLQVVTSTTILGDVVGQIVGDSAAVTTLMPAGADPHSYQPSAQEVESLVTADFIVVNGAGLEAPLDGPLAEAVDSGVPVFRAVDHVDTLLGGHTDHDDGEDEEGHSDHDDGEDEEEHSDGGEAAVDPHFWMDPLRMAEASRALGQELQELSANAGFDTRAQEYAGQLEELDEQVAAMLNTIPPAQRELVTNHDSLAYFADRYDFQILGTVIPSVSTGAEPSAQDLAGLANTVREAEVRAIFSDSSASTALAEALAAEVGAVQIVQLHTGSLDASGGEADSYEALLLSNAEKITAALVP